MLYDRRWYDVANVLRILVLQALECDAHTRASLVEGRAAAVAAVDLQSSTEAGEQAVAVAGGL